MAIPGRSLLAALRCVGIVLGLAVLAIVGATLSLAHKATATSAPTKTLTVTGVCQPQRDNTWQIQGVVYNSLDVPATVLMGGSQTTLEDLPSSIPPHQSATGVLRLQADVVQKRVKVTLLWPGQSAKSYTSRVVSKPHSCFPTPSVRPTPPRFDSDCSSNSVNAIGSITVENLYDSVVHGGGIYNGPLYVYALVLGNDHATQVSNTIADNGNGELGLNLYEPHESTGTTVKLVGSPGSEINFTIRLNWLPCPPLGTSVMPGKTYASVPTSVGPVYPVIIHKHGLSDIVIAGLILLFLVMLFLIIALSMERAPELLMILIIAGLIALAVFALILMFTQSVWWILVLAIALFTLWRVLKLHTKTEPKHTGNIATGSEEQNRRAEQDESGPPDQPGQAGDPNHPAQPTDPNQPGGPSFVKPGASAQPPRRPSPYGSTNAPPPVHQDDHPTGEIPRTTE